MPSQIDLLELQGQWQRGEDLIAIHYGCENLYTATDHPPAVSCVSACRVGSSGAESFSVVDFQKGATPQEAEIGVLKAYLDFMRQNSAAIVHWNMSKADYGFSALEARYRFSTGEEAPYRVPRDRTYDIDDLIAKKYGDDYAPHPRLMSIAALNGLSRHHALRGSEEAERFAAGDHGSVRRSIDEKAHWIASVADLFLSGRLKTTHSVGSVEFAKTHLDAVQTVIAIGQRFLYVERELLKRHDKRPTLTVENEYDAQDLYRALLRMFFDDVRPEDYTASYAGGASRVDFVLPEFELAVELKRSRPSMTAKLLGEQLLIDVARYGQRSDVSHLVCIVFDHEGLLDNPRGLERDLEHDSTTRDTAVSVVILDR